MSARRRGLTTGQKWALGLVTGAGVLGVGYALWPKKAAAAEAPFKPLVRLPEDSGKTVKLRQGDRLTVRSATVPPEGYIDVESFAGDLQLSFERTTPGEFRVIVGAPVAGAPAPVKSTVAVSIVHKETGQTVQVVGTFDIELVA